MASILPPARTPASRVCCQCCPCARQCWPLQGHQRVSMCVMCQTVCACACLHGKEAAEGGGRDDFEGGLRKEEKKKKKERKRREFPLFCDMKQKAFIFMAIRDG